MCNQATNLTQWKNWADEQKADADFENYKYEFQFFDEQTHWELNKKGPIDPVAVYRLVIQPDKYYYIEDRDGVKDAYLGANILKWEEGEYSGFSLNECTILRPAKPDEIPKQEKTLEDRIKEKWPDYEVVMLFESNDDGCKYLCLPIREGDYECHTFAQSMGGFYKYVYNFLGDLGLNLRPIVPNSQGKTVMPVAVLFEKESGASHE